MKWLDEFFERKTRKVAQSASRRSALIGIGKLLVGSAFVLPVLPFDRTAQAAGATASKKAAGKSAVADTATAAEIVELARAQLAEVRSQAARGGGRLGAAGRCACCRCARKWAGPCAGSCAR